MTRPHRHHDYDETISIGDRVCKRSRKPFKSRNQVNTVAGITINENTQRVAFTFVEDDSTVDAWICRKVEDNE